MLQRIALALTLSISALACGDDGGGSVDAGQISNASPSKRSDIHGAMDPTTGVFVVFGGDDGPIVNQRPQASYRDDTWIFEPGIGWSETDTAGPSARGRHAVAFDSENPRMLLFGGRYRATGASGDYTLYNDLWSFSMSDRSWTMLSDGSNGPDPRYFSTAAYDSGSDSFYVYGGATNTSPLGIRLSNELWAFRNNAWEQVAMTGMSPSPLRLYMAYTHDTKRNRLIAFGGQLGDFTTPAYNDLYALDLNTGVWSELESSNGPEGRFSALMTYDAEGDRYLVMGGHVAPGVANDLWAYNPNDGSWAAIEEGDRFTGSALGCLGNEREIPKEYVDEDLSSPERRSGGFLGYSQGEVWLFGGESDCSDHLDDTRKYSFEDGAWEEVLSATSGESCARANNDCTCLCL